MTEGKSEGTERRELAKEAAALLSENHAYAKAWAAARKRLFAILVESEVGSPQAVNIHAQLKALQSINDELQGFINDYNMTLRRPIR